MATVPSPRTWTVGELLTAAKLNTDLRDGLNFLLAPPRVLTQKSTSQTGLGGSTFHAVTWDNEITDTDGGHSNSTNNTRYTIQTAGAWEFSCSVLWSNDSSTGGRAALFRKNGSTVLPGITHFPGMSSGSSCVSVTTTALLSVSDYVEVIAFHSAGSNLTLNTSADAPAFMSARWVGTT